MVFKRPEYKKGKYYRPGNQEKKKVIVFLNLLYLYQK